MKKNGFTLVELLAVIAILAILVIIALPNVMGMFNTAKKNSFVTELKEVYKVAQQEWMMDSMTNTDEQVYSRCDTCSGKTLQLTGRTELDYYIKFDKAGRVSEYYASDGTYQFSYTGDLDITKIEDVQEIAELRPSEIIKIPPVGSVINPVSFSTDSWTTIITAVRSGNTSVYNVGDTRTIDLGSLGTHTLRLANKSTPSECSTSGFSQTACGFVVEFVDIISDYQLLINQYNSNVGGWASSSMRSYLNSTVYNALPNDLKNGISNTFTVSGYGSSDSSNFTTTDKIYLLAAREVWGKDNNTVLSDTAVEETRQLDYYKNIGVSFSNYSSARKSKNGTYTMWSLRTVCRGDNDGWYGVKTNGGYEVIGGADSLGVSPAFRIG